MASIGVVGAFVSSLVMLLGHSLGLYHLVVMVGSVFCNGVYWWLLCLCLCFSTGLLLCPENYGTSMVLWTYLRYISSFLYCCLFIPVILVWLSCVGGSIERHLVYPSDGSWFCDFLSSISPYSCWAFNYCFGLCGLPIILLHGYLMIDVVSITCGLSHFIVLATGGFNIVDILFITNIWHYDFNHHNTNHFGSLSYPGNILFYSNTPYFVLYATFSVPAGLFISFLETNAHFVQGPFLDSEAVLIADSYASSIFYYNMF